MRATYPLGRAGIRPSRSPEAAGPAAPTRIASAARRPDDGAVRGDPTSGAGRRAAGVSTAGQAMTNAGVLAGFAQEARS
ncbi:hypothetical protein AB0C14_29790 [Microbispora hainanensis]|uniref:hypothetical protein n=1 Tax=Microbispora hainanensis TaxID=568844 RepID=UPI0033C3E325